MAEALKELKTENISTRAAGVKYNIPESILQLRKNLKYWIFLNPLLEGKTSCIMTLKKH